MLRGGHSPHAVETAIIVAELAHCRSIAIHEGDLDAPHRDLGEAVTIHGVALADAVRGFEAHASAPRPSILGSAPISVRTGLLPPTGWTTSTSPPARTVT